MNGCLSARREPPLICTECWSSTTAHTHTWRAARAFEGECRTSISKPECKWTQHLHVVTAKCKNKHLRLQNSWAFSSQLNQDTGTIAQSAMSANYTTDSCGNNFAFMRRNQKGKQIQTEVPTWQASSKHWHLHAHWPFKGQKLGEWLQRTEHWSLQEWSHSTEVMSSGSNLRQDRSESTFNSLLFNFKIDEISTSSISTSALSTTKA